MSWSSTFVLKTPFSKSFTNTSSLVFLSETYFPMFTGDRNPSCRWWYFFFCFRCPFLLQISYHFPHGLHALLVLHLIHHYLLMTAKLDSIMVLDFIWFSIDSTLDWNSLSIFVKLAISSTLYFNWLATSTSHLSFNWLSTFKQFLDN